MRIRVAGVLLISAVVLAAADDAPVFGVPPPIVRCLRAVGKHYQLSSQVNPYYVRGDFWGDRQVSYAFVVKEKSGGAQGIVFCPAGDSKPIVLGAGTTFNRMRDLSFEAWRVYSERTVRKGADEGPPPQLRSEALLIIWPESASALVYWDGSQFRWYQQGD